MAENTTNLKDHYEWLNSDFFHRILSKDNESQTIKILDYEVKPALNYGENYGSQMIRANVTYLFNVIEERKQRFVIKALVLDEMMAKAIKDFKIFEREILVYQNILPAVEKLLKLAGDDTKLSPRCFEVSAEKFYLVFEDLTVSKFKNADRQKGLDKTHFEILLTKLAKWHAGTAVLLTMDCENFKEFERSTFYNEDSMEMRKFIVNSIDAVARLTKNNPNYDEAFSEKLSENADALYSKVCRLAQPDENDFKVLTHGDLWANNIMFAYDDNCEIATPRDVRMVDFQISCLGSVVSDLAYTLFTSSQEDVTDRDWDHLLQHYHVELKSMLLKLGYSKRIPTLTEIHSKFVQKAATMAPISLFVLGIRHFEGADETTNSKFVGDSEEDAEYRYNIMANPNVQKCFKFLLDYFDRKGFLDV